MASEDLEKKLDAYLERREEERRQGHTFEAVHRTLQNLADNLAEHEKNDAARFGAVDDQFKSSRLRIENLETGQEKNKERIEGARDRLDAKLDETRDQLREVRIDYMRSAGAAVPKLERSSAWKELNRGAVGWFVKGAIVALGGGVGALVHALISGH